MVDEDDTADMSLGTKPVNSRGPTANLLLFVLVALTVVSHAVLGAMISVSKMPV